MKVSELIEHLKTLNQFLPVWFQSGGDGFYPANESCAVQYTLADDEGNNEFEVCLIGEIP